MSKLFVKINKYLWRLCNQCPVLGQFLFIYVWIEGTSLAFQKKKTHIFSWTYISFTLKTKHSQRIAKVRLFPKKLDGEF